MYKLVHALDGGNVDTCRVRWRMKWVTSQAQRVVKYLVGISGWTWWKWPDKRSTVKLGWILLHSCVTKVWRFCTWCCIWSCIWR